MCLQSLQTFKLRYAELLADFGYVDLAREYVVSIRQLTGIGLDESSSSQAPPPSGNTLAPVFPDDFVDRLYRFEDRLCVLTGTNLSCKRKKGEEHRKSALAAITGGFGSVFSRKTSDAKENDNQQQETKLDEPSSENEFMSMIETNPNTTALTSRAKSSQKSTDANSLKATELTAVASKSAKSSKPSDSEPTPKQQFSPFHSSKNPSKDSEQHNHNSIGSSLNTIPTGDVPPASAPPIFCGDTLRKATEQKPIKPREKIASPVTSTPSSKHTDKKAPSSEPPREWSLCLFYNFASPM
jgi:hypothetical protein